MKTYFTGLIEPKCQEKHFINGREYYYLYSPKIRVLLKVVKFIQLSLWKIGVAIHDPIFGECTPDFNCCEKEIGRKSWLNIPQIEVKK